MKQILSTLLFTFFVLLFIQDNKGVVKKAISYAEIERALNSAYIRAYSESNLFKKALSSEGLRAWNDTLTGVKSYVRAKGHNSKAIDQTLYALLDLSHSIENTIKLARNTKAVNKSTTTQRDQLTNILESLQNDFRLAKKQIDSLKSETFLLNRSDRNEARKLLVTLYNILEAVAQKTNKDALVFKP